MIKLIIGLGNPGQKYENTRHNAGLWMLEQIAKEYGGILRKEAKFLGEVAKINVQNQDVRLLFPTTFMNLSGQSVASVADYFKLSAQEMLVLHDELDLSPGTIRLKKAGGHGGHNGLRDIIQHLGKEFYRVRIGIGHPGNSSQVANFVLKCPSNTDRDAINSAISQGLGQIQDIITGKAQKAMNALNQKPKKKKSTKEEKKTEEQKAETIPDTQKLPKQEHLENR